MSADVSVPSASPASSIATPLGNVGLWLDGKPVDFLVYDASIFDYEDVKVDANKRLCYSYVADGRAHVLECKLDDSHPHEWDVASGERLQGVEFVDGTTALNVTTEWDDEEYAEHDGKGDYDYCARMRETGLRFEFSPESRSRRIIMGVAWHVGYTYETRFRSWLVADPTIDRLSVFSVDPDSAEDA